MGLSFKANNIELVDTGMFPVNGEDKQLFHVDDDGDTLWMAIYKLNDCREYTFKEIADWIEANVDFI